MSSVAVIIPVHNGGEPFRRCLESVTRTVPQPAELIVVADGDSDGSWRVAEEFGAQVIRVVGPKGPAQARNIGARTAHSELLFFVDADVTIPSDAVERVTTLFASEPGLAAAFGSYDDAPAAPNFLSQYKNLLHHYVHQTSREEASTFWGACGAIRRDIFLTLGGFDERYQRPSIEDIELGYRLKRAGYRVRLDKALQVKHLKRWGIGSLLKADILLRAFPWTELIVRERVLPNDLNVGFSSRLSALFVYLLIGALVGAVWWPSLLVLAGILTLALVGCNLALYRFFFRKRGLYFTLHAMFWHWFYYAYSALTFAVGSLFFHCRRRARGEPGAEEKTM